MTRGIHRIEVITSITAHPLILLILPWRSEVEDTPQSRPKTGHCHKLCRCGSLSMFHFRSRFVFPFLRCPGLQASSGPICVDSRVFVGVFFQICFRKVLNVLSYVSECC